MKFKNKVIIGTSGYNYYDWKGNFYPKDIKSSDMLKYYTGKFNGVEINSSFYKLHTNRFYSNLNSKSPDNFTFIIKLFRELTHRRKDIDETLPKVLNSIKPILEAGKFGGFLAQFPPSFTFSEDNLEYIIKIKSKTPQAPIFVEFRHPSWCKEETYSALKKHEIGYVCVDGPDLPHLMPKQNIVTSREGYIRFHGRNKEAWQKPPVGKKYDYLYSKKELKEYVPIVHNMLSETKRVFIFFNNGYHGHAPVNALQLMELLKETYEDSGN